MLPVSSQSAALVLPLKKCFKEVDQAVRALGEMGINGENWNQLKDGLLSKLPDRKVFRLLKQDALQDFLKGLVNLSFDQQKKYLDLIDEQDLESLRKNLDEDIKLIAKCGKHLERLQAQDAIVAVQAVKPVKPRAIDNLLLAFSYFSTDQEPDGPWHAIQVLQIYGVMMAAPLFLSSEIEDLFSEDNSVSRLSVFYLTMISMVGVYGFLSVYKKYLQPIPRVVKPLRNFTQEAREGRFDPLLARDNIIKQIFSCWASSNRETRQHPLLVGDPGVGKTAIFTEVARRMAFPNSKSIDEVSMGGKEMFGGPASLLLPGSPLFESDEKMERIIKRLEPYKYGIALALDEIHALFATASPAMYTLFLNLLDTSVRGFPFVLGATTFADYSKHIAKDPAIARRFRVIKVPPTTPEQTVLILREMARRHAPEMEIPEKILQTVYKCTSEKIVKYNQPDISKRILSSAIAEIRLARHQVPSEAALDEKRTERENLLSQCVSSFELSQGFSALEREITALEEKCAAERSQKEGLEALIKRQAETKSHIYSLASKVDRKLFSFYYYFQRPALSEQRKKLEEQLNVQVLSEEFIESVVDKFLKDENEIRSDKSS